MANLGDRETMGIRETVKQVRGVEYEAGDYVQ